MGNEVSYVSNPGVSAASMPHPKSGTELKKSLRKSTFGMERPVLRVLLPWLGLDPLPQAGLDTCRAFRCRGLGRAMRAAPQDGFALGAAAGGGYDGRRSVVPRLREHTRP